MVCFLELRFCVLKKVVKNRLMLLFYCNYTKIRCIWEFPSVFDVLFLNSWVWVFLISTLVVLVFGMKTVNPSQLNFKLFFDVSLDLPFCGNTVNKLNYFILISKS